MFEWQVGAGHAAKGEPTDADHRHFGGQRDGGGGEEPLQPAGRRSEAARQTRGAGGAAGHPRRQRHGVHQFHSVEGDVQLAEQDDLAEECEQSDEEEAHGDL